MQELWKGVPSFRKFKRIVLFYRMPNVWNNKELIFILDHIDGNASNNKRNNFRLICPNCDSQLDTYKSKNKNGSRYYYRYGKKELSL